MSQYSEVIGSFLRRGSFPLEADYVFKTEEALRNYYNQPENKAILHKGLLKIVEDDGSGVQSLYWVVGEADGTLTFSKLITSKGIGDLESQLKELSEKLEKEIQDRKDADEAIWGTNDPTNIPNDLNSILDLSNAILELREKISGIEESQTQMKDEIMALAGTTSRDVIEYLNTLDYPSLTKVSEKLNEFFNTENPESEEIDTWVELKKFLKGITDDATLSSLLEEYLNKIYGDPLPSKEFLTLREIEDFVRELKSNVEYFIKNIQKEINDTQVGVGLDSDGKFSPDQETNYLKDATSVMNALKTLDFKIKDISIDKALETENQDVVKLDIRKELERTFINAYLELSSIDGNGLKKQADGLYMKVTSEYNNGVLTLKINDSVVAQHVLGISSIVEDAYYDSSNEEIVIVFKLLDGNKQTIHIPVGSLIREWIVDNSGPSDTVILTRIEDLTAGPDKLSADVRLYVDKYNILVKQGNSLYVRGTSDNIVHNDVKVSEILEELKEKSESNSDEISKVKEDIKDIQTSVSQAQKDIDNLESRVEKVEDNISNTNDKLSEHILDSNNPHRVTKDQVGLGKVENLSPSDMPISNATQKALDSKADLVDGKVPSEQLPELSWIEV